MAISNLQKDEIGLTFLLNQMSADSPYGAEKIKDIELFKAEVFKEETNREDALEECFGNIEKVIELIKSEPDCLHDIRRFLMSFKNIRKAVARCCESYLNEVELFEVKSFLLSLEKFINSFNRVNAKASIKGIAFTAMDAALDILDPEKKRIAPFSISERYSKALHDIRQEKAQIEELFYKENDSGKKADLNIQRLEILGREEAEETLIKQELSKRLAPFVSSFNENMDNIGKLDLLIQKAELAIKNNAVRPVVGRKRSLQIENMFNPMVASSLSLKGKTFTPVSINLVQGVTVITGANMGGKSVALKTVTLNVLLCQMGFFVCARKAEIPLFDDVFIIAGDLQDLEKGLSNFGAEIIRFNEIALRMKGAFLFVALDEFARGTNPEEGAVIARAVASCLAEKESICVLTTHYDNVAASANAHYQIAGLSASTSEEIEKQTAIGGIDGISALMDYRIVKAGKQTPPRDALRICRILGLDDDIINRIESYYSSPKI